MKCQCSRLPAELKITKVGNTEVGLLHLERIFRQVYFSPLKEEAKLKDEILKQVKIYNYVPPEHQEAYRQALWEEYQKYVAKRKPATRREASPGKRSWWSRLWKKKAE